MSDTRVKSDCELKIIHDHAVLTITACESISFADPKSIVWQRDLTHSSELIEDCDYKNTWMKNVRLVFPSLSLSSDLRCTLIGRQVEVRTQEIMYFQLEQPMAQIDWDKHGAYATIGRVIDSTTIDVKFVPLLTEGMAQIELINLTSEKIFASWSGRFGVIYYYHLDRQITRRSRLNNPVACHSILVEDQGNEPLLVHPESALRLEQIQVYIEQFFHNQFLVPESWDYV